MTETDVKELIQILENLGKETIDLKLGSGRKEYDICDIFVSRMTNKVIFATESYADYKRKSGLAVGFEE